MGQQLNDMPVRVSFPYFSGFHTKGQRNTASFHTHPEKQSRPLIYAQDLSLSISDELPQDSP